MPRAISNQGRPRRRASFSDFEQLLGLNGVAPIRADDIIEGAEAALYERVSTTRQMNTDADIEEDGNSIATQREWCIRRCKQLKAPIAKEFVEPGNSAQSIAKRPVFKELLRYLEDNPQVGYVVIYMRSRAFRNYTDAAIAKRILAMMGVKLVSAKEEFGDGYMGDAMEAITDIMNEVQVRQNGDDISNKMFHKAKNGGTTGRAKLGYLNVRKDFDGRLVNTIEVDQERAPLIQWAFEQYATGEYSLTALQQELADQGLTTRKTAKWAAKPISRSQLGLILRDPYYLGMVTFKGEVYPGRHEALVTPELFNQVQRVIDVRMRRTQRDITHNHFLRSLMHCARCHAAGRRSQLVYSQPVNHAGQPYEYYHCRHRQEPDCGLPHLRVSDVESAMQREVSSLRLTHDEATALREHTTSHLERRLAVEHDMRVRLKKELATLDVKEQRLLDLAADASIPTDSLRKRLKELQVSKATLQHKLARTDDQVREETDAMLAYIALLEYPGQFYAAATDGVKRKLLSAFYTHLWLDDDGSTTSPSPEIRDVVIQIHDAAREAIAEQQVDSDSENAPNNEKSAGINPSASDAYPQEYPKVSCSNESNLVGRVHPQSNKSGLLGQNRTSDPMVTCSNKVVLVAGVGFEPTTFWL